MRRFGAPGRVTRRFGAPGRVNLIGDHTDHTGGLALPAALDREVTVTVEAGGDRIRLTSAAVPGVVDVAADGSDGPADGWGRYVAAVAAEMAALGRPPVGLTGTVDSTVPTGAGVSSSAALEVAVAVALCGVAEHPVPPVDLALACQRAEHRAVGVPSGILDQAASVLGRAGHALLLDCRDVTVEPVPLPDDLVLLVLDSRVSRSLEESPYARRSAELARALPALHGRRPADVDPADLAGLGLCEVALRRLRHVVTENARVREAVGLLRAGEVGGLGPVFAASQASAREDYENSTPEIEALVRAARGAGALAARMTGGGFGGCVVALVRSVAAEVVAAATVAGYRDATGLEAVPYACRAGDAAGER